GGRGRRRAGVGRGRGRGRRRRRLGAGGDRAEDKGGGAPAGEENGADGGGENTSAHAHHAGAPGLVPAGSPLTPSAESDAPLRAQKGGPTIGPTHPRALTRGPQAGAYWDPDVAEPWGGP